MIIITLKQPLGEVTDIQWFPRSVKNGAKKNSTIPVNNRNKALLLPVDRHRMSRQKKIHLGSEATHIKP